MIERVERVRLWAADWSPFLVLAAFGSAIFLTFAMLMPNWLARTSWSRANRRNDGGISLIDSPASFVWLVSLCGFIALVVLAIATWRRWAPAAALAAAAFAYGAYVSVNFWVGHAQGRILLDGRPTEMGPPRWEVHTPPLLPLFVLAALTGAVSTVGLAIAW